MGTITKWIKGNDDFGHTVAMNFNRNGETVNTIIGGLLSFIIRWGLRGFLLQRILIVYNNNASSFGTVETPVDFKEMGKVKREDMKLLIYYKTIST